jgi:hypothetical protein
LVLDVSKSKPEQELRDSFLDFLKAVAKKATYEFGPNPKHNQQSKWMVKTGPSKRSYKIFEREVFDSLNIFKACKSKWVLDSFPEKERLKRVLKADGFTGNTQQLCLSLLHNWLQLPDPLAFEEHAVAHLLDEFVDAVLKNRITTKSRSAIEGLIIANSPILLEESILIRQITENELWDLGDIDNKNQMFSLTDYFCIPDDSWEILEIELQLDSKNLQKPYTILDVVLAAFRLESSGSFRVVDLGTEANFYSPGRMFGSFSKLRFIGGHAGTCVIDEKQIRHLQKSWPDIRQIMESDKHYLKLPAQRLLDGVLRDKPEDAVLDYAIGLKRLLTAGTEDELRYRFALRGATVLCWEKGNMESPFEKLKQFYDRRSFIVHGSTRRRDPELSPSEARSIGEDYLRQIWWWFFKNGFREENGGLDKATKKIDDYVIKKLSPEESCHGGMREHESEI